VPGVKPAIEDGGIAHAVVNARLFRYHWIVLSEVGREPELPLLSINMFVHLAHAIEAKSGYTTHEVLPSALFQNLLRTFKVQGLAKRQCMAGQPLLSLAATISISHVALSSNNLVTRHEIIRVFDTMHWSMWFE
jgi:hypothetical protein